METQTSGHSWLAGTMRSAAQCSQQLRSSLCCAACCLDNAQQQRRQWAQPNKHRVCWKERWSMKPKTVVSPQQMHFEFTCKVSRRGFYWEELILNVPEWLEWEDAIGWRAQILATVHRPRPWPLSLWFTRIMWFAHSALTCVSFCALKQSLVLSESANSCTATVSVSHRKPQSS